MEELKNQKTVQEQMTFSEFRKESFKMLKSIGFWSIMIGFVLMATSLATGIELIGLGGITIGVGGSLFAFLGITAMMFDRGEDWKYGKVEEPKNLTRSVEET